MEDHTPTVVRLVYTKGLFMNTAHHETLPTLRELAAPLEAPDALPADISVATGIIALRSHWIVRSVVTDHLGSYQRSQACIGATSEEQQALLAKRLDRTRHHEQEAAAFNEQQAGRWQDTLGMAGSIGATPSAEDLHQLFSLDAAAQETSQGQSPEVHTLQARLARAASDQLAAQQTINQLEPDVPLAHHISEQYHTLSRRGRIGTAIAGFAIGVGIGTGLYIAAGPAPRIESNTSQQTPDQLTEQVEQSANHTTKVVLGALAPLVGLGSGIVTGNALIGSFAQRRARSMLANATP